MDPKYAAKDAFHALDKEVGTISTKVDGEFNTMREHMNAQFSDLERRQTK